MDINERIFIFWNKHSFPQNKIYWLTFTWTGIILFHSDFFFHCVFLFLAELSGSNPGTVYIFSDKATVEFVTDLYKNFNGFYAIYTAFNASELTSKYTCNLYLNTTAQWRYDYCLENIIITYSFLCVQQLINYVI